MFVPNRLYSFSTQISDYDASGKLLERWEYRHFEVLQVTHGKNRPKILRNQADDQETAIYARSPLAMLIQNYSLREDGFESDGTIVVFQDWDPVWVSATDFAPFSALLNTLHGWDLSTCVVPAQCVRWGNRPRAVPTMSILDQSCPTVVVFNALVSDGWEIISGVVRHSRDRAKFMDGRIACTKKFYYQTLVDLPRSLELCGNNLPSDQPESFYKVSLSGKSVEPGLGDPANQSILKGIDPQPTAVNPEKSSDDDIAFDGGKPAPEKATKLQHSTEKVGSTLDFALSLGARVHLGEGGAIVGGASSSAIAFVY